MGWLGGREIVLRISRKWKESRMWEGSAATMGWRWESRYPEMRSVGLEIEDTIGLPGLPGLWSLGRM